jgi:cyanophycinase-like exopeptidase
MNTLNLIDKSKEPKSRRTQKNKVVIIEEEEKAVDDLPKKVRKGKRRVENGDIQSVIQSVTEDQVKPKRTRAPSKYNEFVKHHMSVESIKSMEPRSRFGQISKLWREHKAKESATD